MAATLHYSSAVFGMRRSSPVWAAWGEQVARVYPLIAARQPHIVHMAELISMNIVIHRTEQFVRLDPLYNFHCNGAGAMRLPDGRVVTNMLLPFRDIGVIHLANWSICASATSSCNCSIATAIISPRPKRPCSRNRWRHGDHARHHLHVLSLHPRDLRRQRFVQADGAGPHHRPASGAAVGRERRQHFARGQLLRNARPVLGVEERAGRSAIMSASSITGAGCSSTRCRRRSLHPIFMQIRRAYLSDPHVNDLSAPPSTGSRSIPTRRRPMSDGRPRDAIRDTIGALRHRHRAAVEILGRCSVQEPARPGRLGHADENPRQAFLFPRRPAKLSRRRSAGLLRLQHVCDARAKSSTPTWRSGTRRSRNSPIW